jgi:hypothetical protein
MNLDPRDIPAAFAVGLGATLFLDLTGPLFRAAFKIPGSNYCLVGRWLLHMPGGTFRHASIAAASPKRAECAVGVIAHYAIGAIFGLAFILLASAGWLARPSVLPALLFGIATVVMPFFVMQPALGLGVAASRTPDPVQARLRSLLTHTVFGLGLYISGSALGLVLKAWA